MRSVWKKTTIFAALFACMTARGARANPELPAAYDARSVAMGGTGVAFLDGATGGTYFNPALLDGVSKLDVALTVAPFIPMLSSPLAQPGTVTPTKQTDSELTTIPLGLVAAGFRVHERVTVGLGAYVASGIGGLYKNVDLFDAAATPPQARDDFNDMKLQVAVLEGSLPVSVRLTRNLSIGVAWRVSYTTQSTTMVVPNPAGPGLVNRVEQNVSGFSLRGGAIGVRYRASKMLAFGASYRTKMTVDLDGHTDIDANAAPPMVPTELVVNAPTTSQWSTPHQLRLGSSLCLLDDKLLLAFEGRVQLYKDANKQLSSTIDLRGQPLMSLTMAPELTNTTTLGWKNAYTAQVGAEYWVIPVLAVRAGFTLGNSATNARYVSPLAPTPGLLYSFTAGLGARWKHWEAGLAGSFLRGSKDVSASEIAAGPGGVPVAPAGHYEGSLVVIALSAGYHL
jgi:long-subunit fatty acid transport protein